RRIVLASRLVVAAVVLLALVVGSLAEKNIFWLVLLAWGGLGAALGPVAILGLYCRRATAAGAPAGVVARTVVAVAWDAAGFALYELVPGFLAAMLACVVVSLLTRPPAGVAAMFAVLAGRDDAAP